MLSKFSWRGLSIKILKRALALLEDQEAPLAKSEPARFQPPLPVKEYASTPVKTRVHVPATPENPRPLRGREKYQEQIHLAYCCGIHGCRSNDEECPVAYAGETPYFSFCC